MLIFFAFTFISISSITLNAQETDESARQAETYLACRTASVEKYLSHSEGIQKRLLRKLKRKEAKMLRKLAAKDSSLYIEYLSRNPDYDSIAVLLKDTSYAKSQNTIPNDMLDSLKGVQNFLQKQYLKTKKVSDIAEKPAAEVPYSKELAAIKQKLNTQSGMDVLISQRMSALEAITAQNKLAGILDLQKQVYYAKEKTKAWKELADEPDEAEQEAMEYLLGTEGFAECLSAGDGNHAFGGLGKDATAEQLQAMGFQTKSQVRDMLQQKLGNNLGAMQQQMADQIKDYNKQLGNFSNQMNEFKEGINETKQTFNNLKQAKASLKEIERPAFKSNPERAKPFWKRIERNFNFQTTRSSTDKFRPAMLELGAGIAFRHTPRLSYGLGIGLSMGLGQNWQKIKLTYEGISARIYADRKLPYGFSAQAGYERSFRPVNRPYLPANTNPDNKNNINNSNTLAEAFGGHQQSAYLGIMKRYKLNKKWNGTLLAGYNFLWRQEEMKSPFMLRFGWGSQ